MRRVAEIIHVVPEEREEYLKTHLNPSEKVAQILWIHGIRNQVYFALNDLLLMSFEYVGNEFYKDMAAIAAYPEMKNYLVQTRRRDVPRGQADVHKLVGSPEETGNHSGGKPAIAGR